MQNMKVYSADWHGDRTFKMIPIAKNCPYNEAVYDVTTKVLIITSKEHIKRINVVNKPYTDASLIYNGTIPLSTVIGYPEKREVNDTYYQYYMDNPKDIRDFIELFAVNTFHPILKVLDDEQK